MFETGIVPETLIDYAPLDEWWGLWRGATLPNAAVQKALATARSMHLIDDKWFLENVEGRGGKTKGTDAVADTLTKDDVIGWIRGIHASGDATPAGVIAARGWDNVLAKTSPEALLAALDAFARKVHLVTPPQSTLPKPISSPPLDGFEGMPQVDLSAIDPDASPLGGWGDDPPPQSLPGELLADDQIEAVTTPHRPPPLPK
jgi:hypothetical protein